MKRNNMQCIDINSHYCPCLLAETNHCTFCSHLMGKETCNCNWSGVCILYEKHWKYNGNQVIGAEDTHTRIEEETQFTITEKLGDTTYLVAFELSPEFAVALNKTGSFVFLRCPNDPMYFNFPVGIMKTDNHVVEVVVETIGPKSSKIFMNHNDKILVRGPYYNGILGHPWIDNITNGKILLVAGGIGQAPVLPLAIKMSELNSNNTITALLAPGKVGKIFVEEKLRELGITTHTVPSMRKDGILLLKDLLQENLDLIVSGGPDAQHNQIIDLMNSLEVNIPMAATNNATMCCGEGICGSCLKRARNKDLVRICKIQTEYINIMDE